MRFIRFTQDRTTVEANPQTFLKDYVYELPPDSCDRWLRRNVAVEVENADGMVEVTVVGSVWRVFAPAPAGGEESESAVPMTKKTGRRAA